MDRRNWLRAAGLAGFGAMVAPSAGRGVAGAPGVAVRSASAPDLVIRGGELFDGTGAPGRTADVAITGERITGIGIVREVGVEEIDARGLAVSPGFIDVHSHADRSLLVNPNAESRVRQGVSTEIAGQDGSSIGLDSNFGGLAGFFRALEANPPTVNFGSMVGHGTLRAAVVGLDDRPSSADELVRMRELLREGLGQGALGLSSGLEYTPGTYAPVEELVALATELRDTGLPYASHMRNEDDRLLAAIEEALHVGRMAGVSVQISHLKAQGERNFWKAESALHAIESARESGLDVHLDRYPYIAYSTGLTSLFPGWARSGGTDRLLARIDEPDTAEAIERFTREKIALLGSWNAVQITSTGGGPNTAARGRRLGELARELGEEPFALTVRLLREEGGRVGMIGFGMSEENTERILAHPLCMICSDGGAYAPYGQLSAGSPHPRGYGTFPRWLGHYVRDRGLVSLSEGIRKITSLPAAKVGLADRGILRVGAFADVAIFDPGSIRDTATFEEPHQYPEGIPYMVVNGHLTLRQGEQTGIRGGRPVRGG